MKVWKLEVIIIATVIFFLAAYDLRSYGMSTRLPSEELNTSILVSVRDEQNRLINGTIAYARSVWIGKSGAVCGLPGGWLRCGPSSVNDAIKIQSCPIPKDVATASSELADAEIGYEVLFIAKEMAPINVVASLTQFPTHITMKRGVNVSLKLHGKTVGGRPKIMLTKDSVSVILEGIDLIEVDKVGNNTWSCTLAEGESYVIGWISKKMFGYQSEPFIASDDLQVVFSPGMPATVEYDFTKTPENIQILPLSLYLSIKTTVNGSTTFLNWQNETAKKPGIIKINGLASGLYQINAHPQNYSFEKPFLHDIREIKIKSGITNQFQSLYPKVDTLIEDGDVTIQGVVYDSEQRPVSNKTVKLVPIDDKGIMFDLYYPPSITDKDGKFIFRGVRPNMPVEIKSDNTTSFLGKESLSENAYVKIKLNIGTSNLVTSVGSEMPDIFVKWENNNNSKLDDFKGKVIVLDFWASWCPPCGRALSEFDILAKEHSWKEDVVFIALSVDYDYDIWKKTVEKSDWHFLRHGWFDREKNSFLFSQPLPYSLIIDTNGKICSAGNGIDLKRELNKIVNK